MPADGGLNGVGRVKFEQRKWRGSGVEKQDGDNFRGSASGRTIEFNMLARAVKFYMPVVWLAGKATEKAAGKAMSDKPGRQKGKKAGKAVERQSRESNER